MAGAGDGSGAGGLWLGVRVMLRVRGDMSRRCVYACMCVQKTIKEVNDQSANESASDDRESRGRSSENDETRATHPFHLFPLFHPAVHLVERCAV
jgi:hypothetical protein